MGRMKRRMLRLSAGALLGCLALLAAMPSSQPVAAQDGTCIDDVTGRTNVCTASDVQLSYFVNDVETTCMPGEPVTLHLRARLLATTRECYDIGIFLALDGGNADTGLCQHDYISPPLSAGGTCSGSGDNCKKDADCAVGETCTGGYDPGDIDSAGGPFYDAEPEDAADECGDLEPDVDTFYSLTPVTVECVDSDGDGFLDIGTAVSWDDQKDNTCEDVDDAIPGLPTQCRYATIAVANVIVYPGLLHIEKSVEPERLHEPGGPVTFTFTVENTSPVTVTLEGLVDSAYGPLEEANGDCTLPQLLSPAETYVCAIHVEISGEPGTHENIVSAWGTDWNKNPVRDTDDGTVTIFSEPPETGLGIGPAAIAGGMATVGLVLLGAGAFLRRKRA